MKNKVFTVLGCLQLTLLQTVCFAATEEEIEQVLVTGAQKRQEELNSVPIAIEVYNKSFIENINASGLSDMELAVPSLNFGRGGRKTRGEIAIRGVGDFSRNIGTDARVAVYVDDVPMGRSSGFNLSLLDIEQVEVLKGPQGTLFGTNTIAGAINIITPEPSDNAFNKLQTSAGNLGYRLYSVTSSLPLSESFFGLIQVGSHESDGFIKNTIQNTSLQGDDSKSARLKLIYKANEHLSVTTHVDWLSEDVNATNALALADDGAFNGFSAAPSPREVAHDAREFEDRDIWGGSLVIDYFLNSGSEVKSISAYRSSSFEELSEEDYSPIPAVSSTFDEEYRQMTQELRFVSQEYERFNYVTGLFLSFSEAETMRSATAGGQLAITPGKLESELFSLYANANYQLSPLIEVNAGIRIQSEQKDIDYAIEDNTGNFVSGSLTDDEGFSAVLPRLSLNFHLPNDALFYASVSRGTKSGGWNADFVPSLDDISFDPEFATNYELGYKNKVFDDKLNINLSTFLTEFKDFQVFQFINTGAASIIKLTNAGEATSKGVELNLSYRFNSLISLTFNSAYTDAKFDSFTNGNSDGDDFSGNKLPYAPEKTAYLALDGEVPITDTNTLFYHVDYSHSDGYFSNPSNTPIYEIDDFYTVSGRVGINLGKTWKISLWGKNLTDETFLRSRDVSFLGIQRGYYEPPRSYGVSVTFSQAD